MGTASPAAVPGPVPGRPLRFARLSDELLARHAARGGERAFGVLYERYHQPLYRYCRSIVRNEADAQDALQSTFAAALSALRRDQRNAPMRPWLYRIAHNEAISLLRRRNRDGGHELWDPRPQLVSSAEDQAAERARWSSLLEDLAGLADRQRSALLMRELSGLSHEEIAIALGTTVGGAKQTIFEARQALAEMSEGRAMSCEDVRRQISAGDRRVLRGRRVRAHLRACAGCEAFAAAIPERRAELRAFAPALPSAAAAAVLSRSLRAASVHGTSGVAAGGAAATAGVVGKAAGTALASKALAGAAILATAAAGATGLAHVLRHRPPVAGPAHLRHHGKATSARGTGAAGSAAGSRGPTAGAAQQAPSDSEPRGLKPTVAASGVAVPPGSTAAGSRARAGLDRPMSASHQRGRSGSATSGGSATKKSTNSRSSAAAGHTKTSTAKNHVTTSATRSRSSSTRSGVHTKATQGTSAHVPSTVAKLQTSSSP